MITAQKSWREVIEFRKVVLAALIDACIIHTLDNGEITESDRQAVAVASNNIAEAVAQAVQQEREACRVAASKAIMRIRTDRMQDNTMAELTMICADAAEDAIRARGGKTVKTKREARAIVDTQKLDAKPKH